MISRRSFIKKTAMTGIVAGVAPVLLAENDADYANSHQLENSGELFVGWSSTDIL